MKFVIVLLFATGLGDIYVFTEPTFTTQAECVEFVALDENKTLIYTKVLQEYGEPLPLQMVSCMEWNAFRRIVEGGRTGI